MPQFSQRSLAKLATCDTRLQLIFHHIILHFDCSILEGHRSKYRQNKLYRTGKSQLSYPHSKHNISPSLAVDVMPHPIDWQDRERMTYFAGQVIATARHMGIAIRWGGDWDNNTQLKDNVFDDLAHYELISSARW